MPATTNCHIKEMKHGDVYCGRGKGIKNDPLKCNPGESGYFGNPIKLNKACGYCGEKHTHPSDTPGCYEEYLKERLEPHSGKENLEFQKEFLKLKGKRLACFCKPKPCHTDIMIKYLREGIKK